MLPAVGFSALLDTMLIDQDGIPIVANGANSAYIDNGTFRLYLDMLSGGAMEAGWWGQMGAQSSYVNVNDYPPGQTLPVGGDTAVEYLTNQADLVPGASFTLAFQERLFDSAELASVDVRYVDDNAGGAPVTPLAGTATAYSGIVGSPVGFTAAAAQAGVPANYVVASIENAVATFGTTDQTITVHLKHAIGALGLPPTTCTVDYVVPPGVTGPPSSVQSQQWVESTDLVTGAVTYTSSGCPEVASPAIAGYVPSQAGVTIDPVTTSTAPADCVTTVIYSIVPSARVADTGGAVAPGAGWPVAAALMASGLVVVALRVRLVKAKKQSQG
jgi:hypothetical protein